MAEFGTRGKLGLAGPGQGPWAYGPVPQFRVCAHCGTVALGVTRAQAELEIAEHNDAVRRRVATDPSFLYNARNAYIEDYEHCVDCSSPWTTFAEHPVFPPWGARILVEG